MEPDVEEERLGLVGCDKLNGIFGRGVQIGRGGFGTAIEDGKFIEAVGGGRGCAVGVAIGEVPLTEMAGAVAGLLEKTRVIGGPRVEPVRHIAREILCRRGKVFVNAETRRKHPGHRSGATRRADGIEHIKLVEIGALAGETIEVWRL